MYAFLYYLASADDGSRSNSPVLGKLLKVQTSPSTFVTTSLPAQTCLPVYVSSAEDNLQVHKVCTLNFHFNISLRTGYFD